MRYQRCWRRSHLLQWCANIAREKTMHQTSNAYFVKMICTSSQKRNVLSVRSASKQFCTISITIIVYLIVRLLKKRRLRRGEGRKRNFSGRGRKH